MNDENIIYTLEPAKDVERPNGRFFEGSFYWVKPMGKAKYEEEWGKQWLDGIDYEFTIHHPFYNRTGIMRPIEEDEKS